MGLSDKHTTCQGSSQRGKESTCQRNAQALPNDTTGGQEARGTALLIFRGGPHERTIVGRLKQGLPQAYHYQAVLATWDICSGKVTLKAIDQASTGCK